MPALNLNITVRQDEAGIHLDGNDSLGVCARSGDDAAAAFGFTLDDPLLRANLEKLIYAYHVAKGNAMPAVYAVSFEISETPITISKVG